MAFPAACFGPRSPRRAHAPTASQPAARSSSSRRSRAFCVSDHQIGHVYVANEADRRTALAYAEGGTGIAGN